MNKEPKTLPQAIKIIVGIYGKNVLNDVRMVNIMNDVVSLEDSNAVKTILRDCLRLGYGGKILAITPKVDFHLIIKRYSKEISDSLGYKDAIVQYILYSIAFGVGICPKEPYLKNNEVLQQKKKLELVNDASEEEEVEERNIPYKYIVPCVALLVAALIYGYNSISLSTEEKELYENKVLSGNSFMTNGDYDKAVESYKEAYNLYSSASNSSNKKVAIDKIDALAEKLMNDSEKDIKYLIQAQKVIQSGLQLNLSNDDKDKLEFRLNEVNTTITDRTDNGRNTLIAILSANDGKLDDAGKQLLDDLLTISPNDYWLNFIKKKSYE